MNTTLRIARLALCLLATATLATTGCSAADSEEPSASDESHYTSDAGEGGPLQPLEALGGCGEEREIGILNNPQYGSFLITGPNIPRNAQGAAIRPAILVGGGCSTLSRARLVTAPAGWKNTEVISTCAKPMSLRYLSPATFVRPKTGAPSQHWMWGCQDMPVQKTVLAAGAGCEDASQKTLAFECVDPKAVVQNASAGDLRMVPMQTNAPYAYVCRELRTKEVCLFPGAAAPTPIVP